MAPASPTHVFISMDAQRLIPLFFLIASPISGQEERHPLYEPAVPIAPAQKEAAELNAGAVRSFIRLPFGKAPEESMLQDTLALRGWRGERVSGQAAAWSDGSQMQLTATCDGLVNDAGQTIPAATRMIRYTQAEGILQPDIIGRESSCDMPQGGVRPIWVEINIPANAQPGVYRGGIRIHSAHATARPIPIELTVEPEILPPPEQWQIHLDLWQHPQAVARWHDVEPWSPEHLALMKPLMQRLAAAGQKAITCSLIDEAWNGQTYDRFPSMVAWTLGKDGVMRYDYSAFDTWVRFMIEEIGIQGQISCYTMIPWSMKIRYYDESSATFKEMPLRPGDPSYEEIWGPFLKDFRAHVDAQGWLDKTCIALDERPDAMLRAAKALIDRYAPEFRIVSAVNAPTAASKEVDDLSPILTHADSITPELLMQRKAEGKKTTFYVCMHPTTPNTYTASPLAEAEWLGIFAAARNLDGFLRWAYNSWNRNPLESADYNSSGNWPSGDCFLVYPGNLSSLRFESLRDGIEDFEKINILRARAKTLGTEQARAAASRMDGQLRECFTVRRSQGAEHAQDVQRAREWIQATAEQLR